MKACCVAPAAGVAPSTAAAAGTGLGLAANPADAAAARVALGAGVGDYNVDGALTNALWYVEALKWNQANKDSTFAVPNDAKPVYIVVARPFIEHLMHSAVVAVAGRDTGATLFGPADMCAAPPPGTGGSSDSGTQRRTCNLTALRLRAQANLGEHASEATFRHLMDFASSRVW